MIRLQLSVIQAVFLLCLGIVPAQAAFDEPATCPQLPALTGDTTTSVGSCATTGPWHKISTQTASAAASMQWTALGTTYSTYAIVCNGVYPATNTTTIYLQFGEGVTPTWETASYQWSGLYTVSSGTTVSGSYSSSGSVSGFDMGAGGVQNSPVAGTLNFDAVILNVPSTTVYSRVHWRGDVQNSGANAIYSLWGGGAYTGDTGAKTAIRVLAASGNITGTCSLWGLATP